MKLCSFKQVLLLFIVFVPFLFLDSTGAAAKFDRNALNVTGGGEQVEYGVHEMLYDGSVEVEQNGKGIRLTGVGHINLTIPSGKLQLEVCSSCTGTSKVCFDTTEDVAGKELACSEFPSFCTFQVKYKSDIKSIYFGIPETGADVDVEDFPDSCLAPEIHTGRVVAVGTSKFSSCKPKLDRGEKMIRLYVNIQPSCPITVKNAQVHVPKILTTVPPKTTPAPEKSTPKPQAKETADAGLPWWAYLIIAAVVILALVVIGAIVYFVCFKKPKSLKVLPPLETVVTAKRTTKVKDASPDVQPSTTTAAPPVPETKDTPSSKRKADLNFSKFEPSKKSKKVQKKTKKVTTQEPTTTEDAPPAPGSRQPVFDLSNVPEPVYKPVYNPKPHRLVPRSMKSAKTDSLEKTLPKERMELIEAVPDSVARHCLKSSESDVVQEMKRNYPEMKRDVLEGEIELLGLPVSQMFKRIDGHARESKRRLSAAGCKFDKNRRITFVPVSTRQILQDESTPATTAYFAFGAEYHQHVKCDKLLFYSLPLLMVIALQKRFDTRVRREACALIRRKMPIVLANYTEAARQKMSYPMNAIEKAYCKDPKPFRNLSEIKTDSESERRVKEMKEAAAEAEKKMNVKGDGRDLKRKKKSSKKRH